MVASAHPLASLTGVEVLRGGGNAMDAGLAMAAMLAVVDPAMTGVGGDASLLYYDAAARRLTGLDGTGRAPREASVDRYRALGCATMPLFGPLTVTVPGAVDAWWLAAGRHGRRPLGALLAPAIAAAEQGVPVGCALAAQWRTVGSRRVPDDADAMRTYTLHGRFPRAGEVLRQPNLARTLAAVAEGGRDAFYRGPVAQALVRSVRDKGGLLALEDLAEHHSEWVEPARGTFHGLDVAVLPPSFQGVALLEQLAILDGSGIEAAEPGSAEAIHRQVEAARLAIADLDATVTDARFTAPTWHDLFTPAHAAVQRARIGERALPLGARGLVAASHTTCVVVVDGEGNALVLMQSLRNPFGSGVVAGDTGVLLQNRGRDFTLDPSHVNALGPGKRTLHTLCPVMLLDAGAPRLALGTIGGHKQTFGTQQVLVNRLVHGMDLQWAVDAPRWAIGEDNVALHLEPGVPEGVAADLAARGHAVTTGGTTFGGSQAVAIERGTGVRVGASDTRYDGVALGF